MPIYEYLCQACGHEIEVIQKIADPLLKECPACARLELKKKLTASAFRLSGSGWYETDFKTGDKKRNLAGGDKNSDSGSVPPKSQSGASDSGKSSSSEAKSGSGSASAPADK